MTDQDRQRRHLQAALRPNDRPQRTLDLLFNIDADGHEYPSDLLEISADN